MVATFHLHYLGHRIKYGNLEVGNTTQQLLLTTRPCCSIVFIELFLFWVILVTCNIGIYICVYICIYIYVYISSTVLFFFVSALHAEHFEHFQIWKKWWNWLLHRSIKWCDPSRDMIFLGVHSESIFPFMEYFFSQENCVSFCLFVSCLLLSQSA